MRVDWQPALILHKRAYRETSLQLDVLTLEHGLIGLIAKGVTGAKKHILRSQLQPLQHLKICFQLKSELGLLTQAELLSDPLMVGGERLMAGNYFNELILKLCPRHEGDSELFQMLLNARHELATAEDLAWLVRRFERDLIGHLGYMTPWSYSASGEDIAPGGFYRIHAELGVLPCAQAEPGALSGRDIIDFNSDSMPSRMGLVQFRAVLHAVIGTHLGNSLPRSWKMIGELSRPLLK
jgi:DNA repair protein RecO (recombination protein O)